MELELKHENIQFAERTATFPDFYKNYLYKNFNKNSTLVTFEKN